MRKNSFKKSWPVLLVFVFLLLQNCTNQEAITPQQQVIDPETNPSVLEKIKKLGFADNEIRDMSDYYLVENELYFPKTEIKENSDVEKPKRPIHEKYFTITIRLDESLSSAMDKRWEAGLEQAIETWNADKNVHFHFVLTTAADANINALKDNTLPEDVIVASEFPSGGKIGASIRVNLASTKGMENPKQVFSRALKHCAGYHHLDSPVTRKASQSSHSSSTAGSRYTWGLYALWGDVLYNINSQNGDYQEVSRGWTGVEAMLSFSGKVYMVQFGALITVSKDTGSLEDFISDGWEGTQFMDYGLTTTLNLRLFIMQNGYIYPFDPYDGTLWPALNGKKWTNVYGMTFFWEGPGPYPPRRLAVLQKTTVLRIGQPSSVYWSVRGLDVEDLSGTQLFSLNIPKSNKAGWNGRWIMAHAATGVYVYNGVQNYVNSGDRTTSITLESDDLLNNLELTTCLDYFITNGTLFKRDYYSGEVIQLGLTGDWAGTSFLDCD